MRSSFSPIIRLKPTTSAARIAASLRLGVDSVKKILIIDDLDLVTLKKYLKKSPGAKLGKEVYRSAYNQGVRIENEGGEKAYPKAWLEMFFGNLDELANFLKD